ncbi:protein of unknown function DUF445 [Desulfurobacterium thermolithotrophum DSM 11699]|uniref:DUF445 domain-containing protein n=1 Tax=Desulfurobacterium thermolithotrophum (strain DSM 11699 / BSA) TaxID=868864 RepID=F0S3Y9_DESTD|nr:DUF445 family protein [Desulfurobacterium thermolithotrophum]ADY73561.1 protein of unknown function DUF445 [Desulfurobacterium thermolithotrophum DSM 11699]
MIELFIPPVVGAAIGYFTNYLAIKMLFRPIKTYYFFGWKVPFTPGLIPSKREKLAEAIAKIVKENLLTEEVLRKRLNEEKIKEHLKQFVEKLLDEFVENGDTYIKEILENIENEKLEKFIDFTFLEERISDLINRLFEFLNGKKFEELLTPDLKKELEKFIDEKIDEITEEILKLTKKAEFKDIIYYGVRNNLLKFKLYFPLLTEKSVDSFSEKISDMIIKFIENSTSDPQLKVKVSKIVWEKTRELLNKKINLSGERGKKLKEIANETVLEIINSFREKKISEVSQLKEEIIPQIVALLKEVVQRKKNLISEIVTERLLQIIEIELPVIMESVDVETLVKNRVNSLPIEEVELIVLKLINEELRYITLLGGVLGFIIGSLQVLFLHLTS